MNDKYIDGIARIAMRYIVRYRYLNKNICNVVGCASEVVRVDGECDDSEREVTDLLRGYYAEKEGENRPC